MFDIGINLQKFVSVLSIPWCKMGKSSCLAMFVAVFGDKRRWTFYASIVRRHFKLSNLHSYQYTDVITYLQEEVSVSLAVRHSKREKLHKQ